MTLSARKIIQDLNKNKKRRNSFKIYIMEHKSNLNPKSGDDQKSTTGENSKIADVISTSQCL